MDKMTIIRRLYHTKADHGVGRMGTSPASPPPSKAPDAPTTGAAWVESVKLRGENKPWLPPYVAITNAPQGIGAGATWPGH